MPRKLFPLEKGVGLRLAKARKAAGLTQIQAAQALGIEANAVISRWEKVTDEPQIGALIRLAEIYGVSINWLLTGEEPPAKIQAEPPKLEILYNEVLRPVAEAVKEGKYIPVRLLSDAAAAGSPAEINESDVEGWALIYADKQWMPNPPHKYTCVHIRGRSMYPILDDGDIVAIDHAMKPKELAHLKRLDGRMCAFRVDGGVTIKWLKYLEDKNLVVGVPENKDELDHLVSLQGKEINDGIVGLVRWWWSKR